jgi:hypothetical protein
MTRAISPSRLNGWTAVSAFAATALMGFCLAGAAIVCQAAAGPVLRLPAKPVVARAVGGAGLVTVQVLARL